MKPFVTTRRAVRRFLLDTQHLLSSQTEKRTVADPTVVADMIRQMECVQLDPVAAVERNQHLVLAARLADYEPEMLFRLLQEGQVFEYVANAACVIPIEDYPLFESIRRKRRTRLQGALDELGPVVTHVLEKLQTDGPLPARAFQSEQRVHGYWDNQRPKTKATSHALNLLQDVAVIRVVYREGSERFFDLTERTIPAPLLSAAETISAEQCRNALVEKYLRAYRVFDHQDARFGWQKMSAVDRRTEVMQRVESGEVVPLDIEGVRRPYYILAADVDRLAEHEQAVKQDELNGEHRHAPETDGPVRFLPPLDNLLWRRERLIDLFDFEYKWEIYTPKQKRRYGYYAMPILAGERLIGRIDPRLDREQRKLTIRLLQIDSNVHVTERLLRNIHHALASFARFHGAEHINVEQTEPEQLSACLSAENDKRDRGIAFE